MMSTLWNSLHTTLSSGFSESLLPWSSPVIYSSVCPQSLSFIITDVGAAYGTARAGTGIGAIGILKPELIMKSIIPVVMAGILGIYGMIVAVILCQKGIDQFAIDLT